VAETQIVSNQTGIIMNQIPYFPFLITQSSISKFLRILSACKVPKPKPKKARYDHICVVALGGRGGIAPTHS
jgi:arginine repressor